MPFRRKHRNPLFSSSRSADKENANEGVQEPLLMQPPLSPRLFRCHSDNSQRTCCDINPNTVSSMKNIPHRNSVLSTKEKMANLLELNSTLVKEISSLRSSQHAISSSMEALKEELQAKSFAAQALRTEKQQLAQEVNKLKKAHAEMKESLESEKNDAEGRLECVTLVVDNLQSMNGVLAEEAARLREDADRHASERQALLGSLDKMTEEKSFFEGLVDSIRATEEEFRTKMQQALLQAEKEKEALIEEKQALMEENGELQTSSQELKEEVEKLSTKEITLKSEKEQLLKEKEALQGELSTVTGKLHDVSDLLASEKQAQASANDTFNEEKRKMRSENEALECSLLYLQEDHQKERQQFEADRHEFENEAMELSLQKRMLSEENDGLKQAIKSYQDEIQGLRQELASVKEAAMTAEAEATAGLQAAEMEKNDAISKLERQMQDAVDREELLKSNVTDLKGKLESALKTVGEEKSCVKAKSDEVAICREKLDKANHDISTLEAKLVAEQGKQKRLEAHIQTMKGDLLIAEDAAIQARTKAKAVEKEAGISIERQSREASQKIGALESKLAALMERQSDLENHIRFKENACRAAIQAEKDAKAKLSGVLNVIQSRGKNIEAYFEALNVSMLEMQRNAMKGNESIACLQAEIASMMEVQVNINTTNRSNKRRGRSRAKAYRTQHSGN